MQSAGSVSPKPIVHQPVPHLERRIHAFGWQKERDTSLASVPEKASRNPLTWLKNKVKSVSSHINPLDTGFHNLPIELRFTILRVLPLDKQRICRGINRQMRALIDDPRMGFWAKIEAIKTKGEIPKPILDLVGGLEAYLKLPVLDFRQKGPIPFTAESSRIFSPSAPLAPSRVRALKPNEVLIYPARFIDEAGRYGLILGFKAGPAQKVVVQTLHEKNPRFVHQAACTWLTGNTDDAPPPPIREDMEFIGDEMRPTSAKQFMKDIKEKGSAVMNYQVWDTNDSVPICYIPTEKP